MKMFNHGRFVIPRDPDIEATRRSCGNRLTRAVQHKLRNATEFAAQLHRGGLALRVGELTSAHSWGLLLGLVSRSSARYICFGTLIMDDNHGIRLRQKISVTEITITYGMGSQIASV